MVQDVSCADMNFFFFKNTNIKEYKHTYMYQWRI